MFWLYTQPTCTPQPPPTHCIYTVDNMRQQKAFPSLFLPKSDIDRTTRFCVQYAWTKSSVES